MHQSCHLLGPSTESRCRAPAQLHNQGRGDRWFLAVPAAGLHQTIVSGSIQQASPGWYGLARYWRSFSCTGRIAVGERALLRFHGAEYLAEVWPLAQCPSGHAMHGGQRDVPP